MANKRIELEQYKFFIKLGEEEPNRKRVTTGAYIGFITMMVMMVFFLVLGMLSGSLAQNADNLLTKPPAPTPSTTPSEGVMPGTQQQIPNMPVTPTENPNQSMVPSKDGALLAQATSGDVTIPDTSTQDQGQTGTQITIPQENTPAAGTVPSDTAKTKKNKGPDKQTKGVGNLSNLVKQAGGRGLQLYFLIIAIGLIVFLYFPLKKIRLQRKAS